MLTSSTHDELPPLLPLSPAGGPTAAAEERAMDMETEITASSGNLSNSSKASLVRSLPVFVATVVQQRASCLHAGGDSSSTLVETGPLSREGEGGMGYGGRCTAMSTAATGSSSSHDLSASASGSQSCLHSSGSVVLLAAAPPLLATDMALRIARGAQLQTALAELAAEEAADEQQQRAAHTSAAFFAQPPEGARTNGTSTARSNTVNTVPSATLNITASASSPSLALAVGVTSGSCYLASSTSMRSDVPATPEAIFQLASSPTAAASVTAPTSPDHRDVPEAEMFMPLEIRVSRAGSSTSDDSDDAPRRGRAHKRGDAAQLDVPGGALHTLLPTTLLKTMSNLTGDVPSAAPTPRGFLLPSPGGGHFSSSDRGSVSSGALADRFRRRAALEHAALQAGAKGVRVVPPTWELRHLRSLQRRPPMAWHWADEPSSAQLQAEMVRRHGAHRRRMAGMQWRHAARLEPYVDPQEPDPYVDRPFGTEVDEDDFVFTARGENNMSLLFLRSPKHAHGSAGQLSPLLSPWRDHHNASFSQGPQSPTASGQAAEPSSPQDASQGPLPSGVSPERSARGPGSYGHGTTASASIQLLRETAEPGHTPVHYAAHPQTPPRGPCAGSPAADAVRTSPGEPSPLRRPSTGASGITTPIRLPPGLPSPDRGLRPHDTSDAALSLGNLSMQPLSPRCLEAQDDAAVLPGVVDDEQIQSAGGGMTGSGAWSKANTRNHRSSSVGTDLGRTNTNDISASPHTASHSNASSSANLPRGGYSPSHRDSSSNSNSQSGGGCSPRSGGRGSTATILLMPDGQATAPQTLTHHLRAGTVSSTATAAIVPALRSPRQPSGASTTSAGTTAAAGTTGVPTSGRMRRRVSIQEDPLPSGRSTTSSSRPAAAAALGPLTAATPTTAAAGPVRWATTRPGSSQAHHQPQQQQQQQVGPARRPSGMSGAKYACDGSTSSRSASGQHELDRPELEGPYSPPGSPSNGTASVIATPQKPQNGRDDKDAAIGVAPPPREESGQGKGGKSAASGGCAVM